MVLHSNSDPTRLSPFYSHLSHGRFSSVVWAGHRPPEEAAVSLAVIFLTACLLLSPGSAWRATDMFAPSALKNVADAQSRWGLG
jgi:hypothetical protein